MRIKMCLKRHPVLSYIAFTFTISWGGVYILGAPYGMPTTSEQFAKAWPIVFIPYFLGPSLASLLLIGFIDGRAGFRELAIRLCKWRVNGRWYAVALLTAPLLVAPILFALSLISTVFLPDIVAAPDKVGLLLTGIIVGLVFGGLLEELGWTGFAVPRLRQRYSIFSTGIVLGIIHAAWHLLPTFWGSGDATGELSLSLFMPPCLFYFGVLPAYRILMVWVHDRTNSLLLVMLMHAGLTATALFIFSPTARGESLMIYYMVLTVAVWIVVAALTKADGKLFI